MRWFDNTDMKVILKQDVEKLGQRGDIVTVKDGFGRNYLIPKGMALVATDSVVRHQQELRRQAAHKILKQKDDAEALRDLIEKQEVVVRARVGEESRIFGTITAPQIAEELASRGLEIDRRKIELDEDIRTLGVFTGSIKLHHDVVAKVKIRVEADETAEA